MQRTGAFYLFQAAGAVSLVFLAACQAPGPADRGYNSKATQQTLLISNRPNTRFYIRFYDPYSREENAWRLVGQGDRIPVQLEEARKYEIAAEVAGYARKTARLVEPIDSFRFRFVEADRRSTARDHPRAGVRIACDLFVTQVSDGQSLTAISHEFLWSGMNDATNHIAGALAAELPNRDLRLAVLPLRSRSATLRGRQVARELADGLAGSLCRIPGITVQPRADLAWLIDEKDLEAAGIVHNPGVRGALAGVDCVIMGGVSVIEP